MQRSGFSLGLLLVMAGVIYATSHQGQTDKTLGEDWWINVPSSPLRIGRNASGRVMTLSNISSGPVTKYQLGCANMEAGIVRVKSSMKVQRTNLEPADLVKGEVYFESLSSPENYKERCDKEKARLAVIKVTFADGSFWKIQP